MTLPPILDPLPHAPLHQLAAAAIAEAILGGRLRPGDKIPEGELSTQLNISRIPLREAIRILEQHGLAEVRPKKGTYVRKISAGEAGDGLRLRRALEDLALQQAMERLDGDQWHALCGRLEAGICRMRALLSEPDAMLAINAGGAKLDVEFHTILVDASGNRLLRQVWTNVAWLTRLMWREVTGLRTPAQYEENIQGHLDLLAVLRRRLPGECRQALAAHIGKGVDMPPTEGPDSAAD